MNLIFDVHLDLSLNAIEWNRDLTLPISEIRALEEGRTDMKGRAGEALRIGTDAARLSLKLATLRTDVEVGINLKACRL